MALRGSRGVYVEGRDDLRVAKRAFKERRGMGWRFRSIYIAMIPRGYGLSGVGVACFAFEVCSRGECLHLASVVHDKYIRTNMKLALSALSGQKVDGSYAHTFSDGIPTLTCRGPSVQCFPIRQASLHPYHRGPRRRRDTSIPESPRTGSTLRKGTKLSPSTPSAAAEPGRSRRKGRRAPMAGRRATSS